MITPPTPPKKTKRQLERHLALGKELITRTTKEMVKMGNDIKIIQAQLDMAHIYIGMLAEMVQEPVIIEKSKIMEFRKTKHVKAYESEDKTAIIIKVEEVEVDDGGEQIRE